MAISNITRKNDDFMAIGETVNFQEKIFKKLILEQICALLQLNEDKAENLRVFAFIYVLTTGGVQHFFVFVLA